MRIRSVRTKLTLWYTGLLALTFLILGGVAYLLVAYTLYEETDSALRSVATALAERSTHEANHYFPPEVDELFRRFFGSPPDERYFEWLDPGRGLGGGGKNSGELPFSNEAKRNIARGVATFETVQADGPYPVRVLTWPVVERGRVNGVIRVGMSRMNIYRTMHRFLLIMAALFPLALALSGGGGWLLATRALKAVDVMTETARRINAGRIHARIALSGAQDELDRLAVTLNDMLTRLEASFTEMRQFTADASHELQTPLTVLRGEMEVALRSERTPEEYRAVLVSSLEEIERISRLVEGLLLLARADAGVLRMDSKSVDLAYTVEEVLAQVRRLAGQKGVSLTVGEMEPLETEGDPSHLRRLLLNLVDNAVKYTPPGGVVRVSLARHDSWAVLAVEDTGPGIPEEEKAQIFRRFYRSPEARTGGQAGSGLGLSIAQSIAEAHGGRIEVASEPGKGARFEVYLPARE